uniref:Uncharacterized protein n=1 Tax=Rhizophora mucronata TaxID=61149 RepID=A0A2P2NDS1_RHIMU
MNQFSMAYTWFLNIKIKDKVLETIFFHQYSFILLISQLQKVHGIACLALS